MVVVVVAYSQVVVVTYSHVVVVVAYLQVVVVAYPQVLVVEDEVQYQREASPWGEMKVEVALICVVGPIWQELEWMMLVEVHWH